MSQYESNPYAGSYQQPPGAMGASRPTSGLAITALVLSLIFCCPLATLPGLILGFVAIATTGPSAPRKGRGLGIAAVILSLIFTAGQVVFGIWMGQIWAQMMNAPEPVLRAGFDGDWATFRANLYTPAGVTFTDQEAADFIDELRSRYGEFQSARMDQQAMQGRQSSPGQPYMDTPYVLDFTSGQVKAEGRFIFADQNTGAFIFRLESITIKDADRGDITFPPEPPSAATPPGPLGSQSGAPAPPGADADADAEGEADADAEDADTGGDGDGGTGDDGG